jgi:hypothetical protein
MATLVLTSAGGATYADLCTANETIVPADSGTLGNCEYVLSNTVDFRGYAVVGGTDTVECLAIPANTWVQAVWINVDRVDADVTDVDFGSSNDLDGFLDGVSFATLGLVMNPVGPQSMLRSMTGATGHGWFFSSADTIDADVNTSHTTSSSSGAKIRVYAKCFTPRAI